MEILQLKQSTTTKNETRRGGQGHLEVEMRPTVNLLYALGVPFVVATPFVATTAGAASLDRYEVTWESPSTDANGSMPLGNGDIGVNAWIEPSGELVFYISKTDAWPRRCGG
jgi:hypothetical protein